MSDNSLCLSLLPGPMTIGAVPFVNTAFHAIPGVLSVSNKAPQAIRALVGAREAGYQGPAAYASPGSPDAPLMIPPCCITGDKLPEGVLCTVKLDWLSCTLPLSMVGSLAGYLDLSLGKNEEHDRGLGNFQSGRYQWASGASLSWCTKLGRAWLQMPGQACDAFGAENWWSLCREIRGTFDGRFTRLDAAADFFDRTLLSLEQVREAAYACNVVGYRKFREDKHSGIIKGKTVVEGYQINFGKRGKAGKGAFVRVYDKALETQGRIDSVRLEIEFSGELAKQIGDLSLSDAEDAQQFARKLGRLITGHIDFRDRRQGKERNLSRMPVLSWWAECVKLLGEPLHLLALGVVSTLQKTLLWFRRQVAPAFAYVSQALESMGVPAHVLCEAIRRHGEPRIAWDKPQLIDATFDPATVFPAIKLLGTMSPAPGFVT